MAFMTRLTFLYPTSVRHLLVRDCPSRFASRLPRLPRSYPACHPSRISSCRQSTTISSASGDALNTGSLSLVPLVGSRPISTSTAQLSPDSGSRYGKANEMPSPPPPPPSSSSPSSSPGSADLSPASPDTLGQDSLLPGAIAAAMAKRMGRSDQYPWTDSSEREPTSKDTISSSLLSDREQGLLGNGNAEAGVVVLGNAADDAIAVGGITPERTRPRDSQGDDLPEDFFSARSPAYVHYFDSWTLVRDLEAGELTQSQAISVMKITRSILARNLEEAQQRLVSRSQVENDSYLFQAACSELRTEIQASRQTEIEHQRSQRAQLQHDVEILSQQLTQELSGLREEVKGLFDDRKMAVRMAQREMESRIQELGHKITVVLNSDARSQIENVRWVLTRRAATALVLAAFALLISLRMVHSRTQAKEQERKEKEAAQVIADAAAAASAAAAAATDHTRRTDDFGLDGEVVISTK